MAETPRIKLKIGVQDLVSHCLRSGDLGFRFAGSSRAVAAIYAHQKLQRSRPEGYVPEVPVSIETSRGHLDLLVSGRVDGLWQTDDGMVVEEIKTTFQDSGTLPESVTALQWAQVKCYGHMVAADKGLEAIDLQLTYIRLDEVTVESHRQTVSALELAVFFDDLIDRYLGWARILCAWERTRRDAICALSFPFAGFRPGQREMAVAVYRTVRDNGQMLVQAATGIGKTLAALFPAIKACGEDLAGKIFFLTARTTGKASAEAALGHLKRAGLRIKALTLTAKERICPFPGANCNPEMCPVAKGHFDRVGEATRELFERDDWTRDAIVDCAAAHRVCPFELSLDLSASADIIICDYNHAFDPRVYLRRFFDEPAGRFVFLVDEAHNLVDRGREMFSAAIGKRQCLDVRKRVGKTVPGVRKALNAVNAWFLDQMKTCTSPRTQPDLPDGLLVLLRRFIHAAERWLVKEDTADFRDALQDLYFAVSAFIETAERFDESYITCHHPEAEDYVVRLFCLDPSRQLGPALCRGESVVFFSGTLTPFSYFKTIFGCVEAASSLWIPSPFAPENRCTVVFDAISTRYRHRRKTQGRLGEAIAAVCRRKAGNYLVFFPSYAYLDMVAERLPALLPEARFLIQKPQMGEKEREAFVEAFRDDPDRFTVGLAVMGGVFGEGIDLVGDRLSGALIVGVGLPAICLEREAINAYFDAGCASGFDFAYRYPAMNRVLQAAGRVIRSRSDHGVIVLMDERFSQAGYGSLLPPDWRIQRAHDIRELTGAVSCFWAYRGGTEGDFGATSCAASGESPPAFPPCSRDL